MDETLLIQGYSLVMSNLQANNGVLHLLDGVIAPLNHRAFLEAYGGFNLFLEALEAADALELLERNEASRVFAPTNEAFIDYLNALE